MVTLDCLDGAILRGVYDHQNIRIRLLLCDLIALGGDSRLVTELLQGPVSTMFIPLRGLRGLGILGAPLAGMSVPPLFRCLLP